MTNKIKAVLPFDLSTEQCANETENDNMHLISLTNNEAVLPSTLRSDLSWVQSVINFLDLKKTAAATSKVSKRDKENADLLLSKLHEQSKLHVKAQVKEASKHKRWILKIEHKNLSVVAVAMLLSNHLEIYLKCLTKNACLLGFDTNQFIPCCAFPWRE
jgi:hypothetical protein